MDDSFRIQVSSRLVDQLAKDDHKLKKKTKKPKAKIPSESRRTEVKEPQKKISDDSEKHNGNAAAGWPLQSPFFVPVNPPVYSASAELDAIRSVLDQSERVVEQLQKQEDEKLQEVTKKAKELHDKEFMLPKAKTNPCLDQKNACLQCYKENAQNPLKCATVVERFADCARRVRQQVTSQANLAA
ncbi:unnamed protein product [Rhodiola kirilowii]